MISKIFHFFVLFAYLNIIVYETDVSAINNEGHLFDGDSLIEFVLDDLLNVVDHDTAVSMDVQHEDYRPFKNLSSNLIIPIVLMLFAFDFFKQILYKVKVIHPFYQAKSLCLPNYYYHLFRFKPF